MSSILSSTKKNFIITSDPQYPWTAKTDDGIAQSNADKEFESRNLIREQYASINDYVTKVAIDCPVIINGDVTAFGHHGEWLEMEKLLKLLHSPYYLSLGNHDIQNNLDDTFLNSALFNSLDNMDDHLYARSNGISRIENVDLLRFNGGWMPARTGSLNYSFNLDNIHFIQLNNDPTWNFRGEKTTREVFNYTQGLVWLEEDLKRAAEYGQVIIILVHKPNGWTKATEADRAFFRELLKKYNVTAAFAGHYHKVCGLSNNYRDFFGDVPVFLSGSASQRTYLIAEYNDKELDVYTVRDNNFYNKQKVKTLDIQHHSKGYYKKLGLFRDVYGKGEDFIETNAPHSHWNDQISSVRLPPKTSITLYTHSNFTGDIRVLNNYTAYPQMYNLDFMKFNDRASAYEFKSINTNEVGLFQHIDGGGENYYQTKPPFSRWNDNISSVYLPPKRSITIYEHTNFSGRSLTLRNPHSTEGGLYNLTDYGFNDITSSYKIFTIDESRVGLFEYPNGGGEDFFATRPPHSRWNDKISSVMLPSGYGIILYEHSNFTGRSLALRNEHPHRGIMYNLNDYNFDNITSAWSVFTIRGDVFGLFELPNGGGESFLESKAAPERWVNNVSSVILPAKSSITFYENEEFSGKSIKLNNWSSEGKLYNLSDYEFENMATVYDIKEL